MPKNPQLDKFKDAARELECDDDEQRFQERLGKLVKQKPVKDADALVLMTEWNEYRVLDLKRVKKLMRGNAFIDLRNIFEEDQMTKEGFRYFCIGR